MIESNWNEYIFVYVWVWTIICYTFSCILDIIGIFTGILNIIYFYKVYFHFIRYIYIFYIEFLYFVYNGSGF